MGPVILLLASLATISSASFSLWDHAQQPLLASSKPSESRNFSVGFSLQSSYGAAAVIFEDADGAKIHTRVSYGSKEYQRVMAKLSLESSKHIAPPYEDDGEYWADQPRVAAREALKKAGLPASYEVGVLAAVVRDLKAELESEYGIRISEAVFTASHLHALYQDDLEDAAQHVGIKYVIPKSQFQPLLWETASAYAGHALGICEHWRDDDRCSKEESKLRRNTVLAVHYSGNALTVSLAKIIYAISTWEPDYRRVENFTLGSDAIGGYADPEDYWRDVGDALVASIVEFPGFPKPDKVMITGDKVQDERFMQVLGESMKEHIGRIPTIISEDAAVVAAMGAAEFMRRGPASWSFQGA